MADKNELNSSQSPAQDEEEKHTSMVSKEGVKPQTDKTIEQAESDFNRIVVGNSEMALESRKSVDPLGILSKSDVNSNGALQVAV